jgi:hypothetical protein
MAERKDLMNEDGVQQLYEGICLKAEQRSSIILAKILPFLNSITNLEEREKMAFIIIRELSGLDNICSGWASAVENVLEKMKSMELMVSKIFWYRLEMHAGFSIDSRNAKVLPSFYPELFKKKMNEDYLIELFGQ